MTGVDGIRIVAGVVALIAISQAHWAGAGYVFAIQQKKRPLVAIIRSIVAIGLAFTALWLTGPP